MSKQASSLVARWGAVATAAADSDDDDDGGGDGDGGRVSHVKREKRAAADAEAWAERQRNSGASAGNVNFAPVETWRRRAASTGQRNINGDAAGGGDGV
jgi:hypothetical protein